VEQATPGTKAKRLRERGRHIPHSFPEITPRMSFRKTTPNIFFNQRRSDYCWISTVVGCASHRNRMKPVYSTCENDEDGFLEGKNVQQRQK